MVAALISQLIYTPTTYAKSSDKPNIVIILADDMGFSDIGCYGGEIRTPAIDSLARDGMRFSQFYNCAKCNTTRASLLTGLYHRNGGKLQTDMVTIAEVLRPAGYRTALSGKWHLGSRAPRRPYDRGFDRYFGLMDGCCNFFNPLQRDPKFKGGRVRVMGRDDKLLTEFPDDFYMTDAISDEAIESIGVFHREQKPFFLHVTYTAPHYPLHALPEDIAKYAGKYMQGWEKLRHERYARLLKTGLIDKRWKLPPIEQRAGSWEKAKAKKWQDLRMAVYAAMIDRMDQGIGRILKKLDEAGIADNTLVMFLSDNGGCAETYPGDRPENAPGPKENYVTCGPGWAAAQNTPFRRYKSWVHEGGISTPMIARWPAKIKPGSLTHQVAHLIDFMPTCLELAGAQYPQQFKGEKIIPVEGRSLLPILFGETRQPHETLYWQWSRTAAVRQGKWKAVSTNRGQTWELYDMQADRTELNDLAKTHPQRAAALSQLWHQWATKTGNGPRLIP